MSAPERRLAERVRQWMEGWDSLGQQLTQLRTRTRPTQMAGPGTEALDHDAIDLKGVAQESVGPEAMAREESPVIEVAPEAEAHEMAVPATPVANPPVPVSLLTEAPSDIPARVPDVAAKVQASIEARTRSLQAQAAPVVTVNPRILDDLDEDILADLVAEYDQLHEGVLQNLEAWKAGQGQVVPELRRQIHTLKGLMGMARIEHLVEQLHALESNMEQVEAGRHAKFTPAQVAQRYALIHAGWLAILHPPVPVPTEDAPTPVPVIRVPSQVTVASELVDRLITETSEARLTGSALDGNARDQRDTLRELHKTNQALGRLLRDLEVYAEAQIQSRRAQLAPGEIFDPLEMDRYTALQELSRSLNEAGTDATDLQRDLSRRLSEQEHLLAYQGRALGEVQAGLHKTRLTPVAELQGRLQKGIDQTAADVGKQVAFTLDSGNIDLDRVLLNRVVAPLEHILRNAIDHGLESPEDRQAKGKSAWGQITIRVRQEAGRASFEIRDDGAGLKVERIQAKAVEKGLWAADRPMTTAEAADMICQPGFSTASAVSHISGRGVGMDVVRSEVLGMGGRFRIASEIDQGMTVVLELPTVVATASVFVVTAGGERWAVPVDLVEDVQRQPIQALQAAAERGHWSEDVGFAELGALMGLSSTPLTGRSRLVLWLREHTRRVMVQVDHVGDIVEVPLRPAGVLWSGTEGVVGVTVLPDGQAAFLIDPLRARRSGQSLPEQAPRRQSTVLVVDDSITVRKATSLFLEREGYVAQTAKDGQEALEMLAFGALPDVVLLDVEMPRMNGFDCLQAIRQSPRLAHLPVIMITSRTASKHRQRAQELQVQGYLGKPFQKDDLAALLRQLMPR